MKTGSVFADVIRSLRKGRHIRLHELAETTGLTIVQVSAFERGVERPTDEQAAALGTALGLSAQTSCLLLDAVYDALAAREAE